MTPHEERTVSRRQYAAALSTITTASLAGCSGIFSDDDSGDDSTDGDDEGDGENGDGTGEVSTDETEEVETPVEGARLLVERMADGRYEAAQDVVADHVREQITPADLEAIWLAYTGIAGTFSGIVDTEETVEGGFDAVVVTLGFDGSEHYLEVVTEADGEVVGLFIADEYEPPEYVDSDSFTEQEVTLETSTCLMEGTITVPDDDGEVPGVLLVHGSDPEGAADRNLSGGGTEPYRDIAEGLASRGIAVLRYDRRTYACPNSVTGEEYTLDAVAVDDALLALEKLRGIEDVDPDHVYVAGHSLGGMAAPRIARRDGDVAGIVALAAPARSFHELIVDQLYHQATVGEQEHEELLRLYEDWSDRIERIRAGEYDPDDTVVGYPGAFWDSLDAYDHVETARQLDLPILFLQGDRDFRVTVEEDFDTLQGELGEEPGTTFELYEGLNHLFLPGAGPSVPSENFVRNTVPRRVIEDVTAWLSP